MLPPWPPALTPVATVIDPLLPPDEVPVISSIVPLTPTRPAFTVEKCNLPLSMVVEYPVVSSIVPPTLVLSLVLPALSTMWPPDPLSPVHNEDVDVTTTARCGHPVANEIELEFPKLDVPDSSCRNPETPFSPALADMSAMRPLEAV
jgi:hypothetical protein